MLSPQPFDFFFTKKGDRLSKHFLGSSNFGLKIGGGLSTPYFFYENRLQSGDFDKYWKITNKKESPKKGGAV